MCIKRVYTPPSLNWSGVPPPRFKPAYNKRHGPLFSETQTHDFRHVLNIMTTESFLELVLLKLLILTLILLTFCHSSGLLGTVTVSLPSTLLTIPFSAPRIALYRAAPFSFSLLYSVQIVPIIQEYTFNHGFYSKYINFYPYIFNAVFTT